MLKNLPMPVNDANAMASVLKSLGFSVIKETDVNQQAMEQAIRRFGNRLDSGDVALFYYSGHGVQIDGTNYLIPLGVSKDMLRYRAVPANVVLDKCLRINNLEISRLFSQGNTVIPFSVKITPFCIRFRNFLI